MRFEPPQFADAAFLMSGEHVVIGITLRFKPPHQVK